ncbi:DNA-binding protein [Bacteroidia bacterium]|nr:DNA-binding protein [Bacteroidia bacterium]
MNQKQLTTELSKKMTLTQAEVNQRLDGLVSVLTAELTEGNTISFPNFGVWEIKKRDEQVKINPASGKKMLIPPKLSIKFKPAGPLKEKVKGVKL